MRRLYDTRMRHGPERLDYDLGFTSFLHVRDESDGGQADAA
jgi:hypothetical protein